MLDRIGQRLRVADAEVAGIPIREASHAHPHLVAFLPLVEALRGALAGGIHVNASTTLLAYRFSRRA